MTLPNHIVGGAVFTGVFGATISGINLLASPWYIAVTLAAAVLPDVDNTSSPVGRVVGPLSYWLNRHYGHRTLTHSVAALIVLTLIFAFAERAVSGHTSLTWFFFWGYLSHIILDMCTVNGVKLFYPFHKSACVIPGDPRYRFETGNIRHETVFFCVAILCGVFLVPLFKNGFWTSYNRLFGTIKHVSSEFHKSDDMLEVEYWYRTGTEHRHGKGYCLEASHSRILLLDAGKFHHISEAEVEVQRVVPAHTGRHFLFKDTAFVSISADSLNRLLLGKKLMAVEIHSNVQFEAAGGITPEIGYHFKGNYLDALRVRPVSPAFSQDTAYGPSTFIRFQNNPRIHTLNRRINLLQYHFSEKEEEYQEAQRRIRALRRQGEAIGDSDIARYEQIRREIQDWEKVKKPDDPAGEIDILKAEIREIQAGDANRFLEKSAEWQLKKQPKIPDSPVFTGYLRYVVLGN